MLRGESRRRLQNTPPRPFLVPGWCFQSCRCNEATARVISKLAALGGRGREGGLLIFVGLITGQGQITAQIDTRALGRKLPAVKGTLKTSGNINYLCTFAIISLQETWTMGNEALYTVLSVSCHATSRIQD